MPLTLLDERNEPVDFDGSSYSQEFDRARLTGQIERVYRAMADGEWRTLEEIRGRIRTQENVDDPEASISAQIRHLKKARFGSQLIEKRTRGDRYRGLWEYRLVRDGER